MKIQFFAACLFLSNCLFAQNYVDILKLSYSNTSIGFTDFEDNQSLHSVDLGALIPIVVTDSLTILTGFDYNFRSVPISPLLNPNAYYNALFKIGFSKTMNARWSSSILVLPKFAANTENDFKSSFLIGALAILKYKRSENLTYKFGAYVSQEAYGIFSTPLLGLYYISQNGRFSIDANLPLAADFNYKFRAPAASVGLDFNAVRRSMFTNMNSSNDYYIENNEITVAPYFQYRTLNNALLLKLKAGYSIVDFGLYSLNDESMIGVSAFDIGKERNRINPEMNGGLHFKFELIYRVNTDKK